ncbi:MAG: hypothetical protein ACXVEC_11685, partial [Nocardioides sp.]
GGVLAALALLGKTWQGFGFPWPLALVGLAVLVLATRRGPQAPTVPPAGTVPPGADPAGPVPPPYGPAAPTTYAGATTYAAPAAAYPQQGYASPTHQTGWVGPALPPAPPARPWPPRRRGPILFWFTLALIALAEGVLGIVDLSGAVDVVGSAYPALAVGLSGLMLLVGAFYGRAGGLILVGLVSAVVLAASTAAGQVDSTQLTRTPTSAAAVSDRYRISSGDIDLDLSRVRDLAALDGRRIHLSAGVGSIRVTLPRGVTAVVHARVDGPGDLQVFGEEHGGLGISLSRRHTASPPDAPTLVIDADLNVGLVEVSYR